MLDAKVIVGTAVVMGAAANSWIESANQYAAFAVTVIGGLVGVATLYYTILRVRKVRAELKNKEGE